MRILQTDKKYETDGVWWSQKVKEEVTKKKRLWEKYLHTKTQECYTNYKLQKKVVKQLVSEEKRKSWEQFGRKLEEDAKANQKLFYRTLRSLRREKQSNIHFIKSKDGSIIKEEVEIMERWREYFQDLLGGEEITDNAELPEARSQLHEVGHEEIKMEEVKEAITTLSECAFADDVVLFSSSGKDLQHNLNMRNETFKKMQMTVNKDKTKVMVLGREEEHINIEIDGQILEQVNTFKYSGVQNR
ncbi:reverse transcriptase (rna-dependent dna polymerase) [Holotrichia oblita]|uniref:Reverse transcriptase (Rna-dependent dna polymerase) n=1 Tax=Holotrichia oblita TaxID=644536 RepID=A0ACB9SRB0_HOLOL|nr:reverse transcriptase (rna-dependent dna polymerase) [Holotrichia oblita]